MRQEEIDEIKYGWKGTKLFIDDMRSCPAGWTLAKTYDEAIEILKTRQVSDISFDHDLGQDLDDEGQWVLRKTGYDVAVWLEEAIFTDAEFPVPYMQVHSSNPAGRDNIQRVIDSIERRSRNR